MPPKKAAAGPAKRATRASTRKLTQKPSSKSTPPNNSLPKEEEEEEASQSLPSNPPEITAPVTASDQPSRSPERIPGNFLSNPPEITSPKTSVKTVVKRSVGVKDAPPIPAKFDAVKAADSPLDVGKPSEERRVKGDCEAPAAPVSVPLPMGVAGAAAAALDDSVAVGGENAAATEAKAEAKTVVKKKVRIVKKVVKKLVPKRVVKSLGVCSNQAQVGNGGGNRNSAVSDSVEADKCNLRAVDAVEGEKIDHAVSVSMEVDHASTNVSCPVEIENPNPNVGDSMEVEVIGTSEVCEGEKDGTLNAIGDASEHGDVLEKPIRSSDVWVEDKNVDLVGGGIDEFRTENVDMGGEVDAGVKEEMENGGAGGGSKEEVEMGNGLVGLSEEMEALERRRRRRTEIFIGGLDQSTKEEDIRKVFEEVGKVVEVRLIVNTQTGKNKGYAFVKYASASDAKKALAKYQKVEICKKLCGVAPVEGNDTIFLGNIDKKWKEEDVRKMLRGIEIEKIDKVTLMVDPNKIECNRGFAFLEFETNKDAQHAYKKLQKKDAFGKHHKIKVAWAEPLNEPDEEEMQKVKTVYAGYIPSSWDEEKIIGYFKKFGEIENVVLARNLRFSKRKDFAFVNYTTREAALACVESLSKELSDDEGSKVNGQVSLAIPLQKGKQNKRVSNFTYKEPTKEKPKSTQRGTKLNDIRSKGKSNISKYEDRIGERRYSKNAELVHLSREQTSWRHSHTGVGIGSANADHRYTLPGSKRPYSEMEEDLYSDSRGYPRARLESSYPIATPRYNTFSQSVGMESVPYHQRQGAGFSSGSPYGITDRIPSLQREGAPYRGSSGLYYRYL